MKTIFSALIIFMSSVCFAGSTSGTNTDSYNQAFRIKKDFNTSLLSEDLGKQVYYMRQKQAEIEFATNSPGEDKVEIHSLRPEEFSNPALLDGLKRSQQSRQWEDVKLPNQDKIKRIVDMLNESK